MTIRDSINNLIRSDKPESPTDFIFIYGAMIFIALWAYSTIAKTQIPHVIEALTFLGTCKAIKVGGNYVKGKANASVTPPPVV